jgi:hypothetical protein
MDRNNVATYYDGIAGGRALKFAVNLPNFVILSLDSAMYLKYANWKLEQRMIGTMP